MARHSILLASAICLASASSTGSPLQLCSWDPLARLGLLEPACPPLVDDKTAAKLASWAPWAYAPHCIYPPDRSDTGKHCIYTYLTANGEGGMSIVSKPETAAFVAGMLAARSEPWGEEPSWQLSPGEHNRAYEVEDIRGKERGVVAKRPIRTGEVIMRETPFVMGFTSGPKGIAREENPWMLKEAFERLPEGHRERLEEVAVSTGGEWHEDAMRTNAFGVGVDGLDLSALYPEIAVSPGAYPITVYRGTDHIQENKPCLSAKVSGPKVNTNLFPWNHTNSPSAFTRYSRATLQMEIVAQQDIEPGEEITITCPLLSSPVP